MKSGMLGAFATLFLGAGWAVAQGPTSAPTPSGVVMPYNMGAQPTAAPLIAPDAGIGGPLWYASADYLLWKVKGGNIPSTATATPFGSVTVTAMNSGTGAPPNQTLMLPVFSQSAATFGDGNRTNPGYQSGGQFSAGFWVDPDMTFGAEARFLFLATASDSFNVNTSPNNAFVAPTGLTQTTFTPGRVNVPSTTFTTPVLLTGNANGQVSGTASNSLYNGELNARCVYLRFGSADFGALAGFRYLAFRDELNIVSNVSLTNVTSTPAGAVTGGAQNFTYSSVDNTRVFNSFYGGQAGLDMNYEMGSFFLYTRGTIAAGNNHQIADVNSTGTTTTPTGTTTTGGLLASPSDNGRHSRDELSYIPAYEAKLGYQFTNWLRGSVGYGGVYLGNFARAGDSTTLNTFNGNANINSTVTPLTVAQPNFRFRDSNVYIQGITFGLEAKY